MWYCDDDLNEIDSELDDVMASSDSNKKPPGFYVRREAGLFPSPLPQVRITLKIAVLGETFFMFAFTFKGW